VVNFRELLPGFDAFGSRRPVRAGRHADGGQRDGLGIADIRNPIDERAIDPPPVSLTPGRPATAGSLRGRTSRLIVAN
jgi:hypothetical protein